MNSNTRQFFEAQFASLSYLVKTWDAFQQQSQSLFATLCGAASRMPVLTSDQSDKNKWGVLSLFHGAPKVLVDDHIEKLESLYKGLSLCMSKFQDIASQIEQIHNKATNYYHEMEEDTLRSEMAKRGNKKTYSITHLLDWTHFLSTSYKRECVLKQQVLSLVKYDMPEDKLNELSRIWSEDSNIDGAEGMVSLDLYLFF
eukprot:TRINITY_DN2800_c0_g1_i3.p1 TRINITY_DN2800_c0_g1~~TRINITY_DN2800_c0_g1_i3.p1  ORF type:complete len:199 (+),score=34.53 TRINITY_DN2800_c0_g1_i3:19-615(+)